MTSHDFVGECDGAKVGVDGEKVGDGDGNPVGESDGDAEGEWLGDTDGLALGTALGDRDGLALGLVDGACDGVAVGSVGDRVGKCVGVQYAPRLWPQCPMPRSGTLTMHGLLPAPSRSWPRQSAMHSETHPLVVSWLNERSKYARAQLCSSATGTVPVSSFLFM